MFEAHGAQSPEEGTVYTAMALGSNNVGQGSTTWTFTTK